MHLRALSTSGTVNIEATFTNVTGSVTLLPQTPLQATELLRASCGARFAGGKTSSLVLAGRDGLPLQPGGLLPSPLYVASDADTPSTGTRAVTGYDQSLQFSLLGSKDRLLSQYTLLPNMKYSLKRGSLNTPIAILLIAIFALCFAVSVVSLKFVE